MSGLESRNFRWYFQVLQNSPARKKAHAFFPVRARSVETALLAAAIRFLTSNMATWCLADDTHRWHGRAVNKIHPLDLIMSGRVQKESADDSDRVDDAVDPRVQVSVAAVRVCVAQTEQPRGGSPCDSVISTLLTLVVGKKKSRHD